MSKRRETPEDLGKTKRISPYQQMEDEYDEVEQIAPDDEYIDNDEEEYEGEYAYDTDEEETDPSGGFFSTLPGKIALAVIALLFIALAALLAIRFLSKPDNTEALPTAVPAAVQQSTPVPAQSTATPGVIVFTPVQQTEKPTAVPTAVPTPTPTAKPEPTNTPLPIILTNTPTPSPSPTPTATPTPTPVATPTPTPAPTAVPSLAKGEVNRDANLRESASSSAKVKQTIERGEKVTVHEMLTDQSGKAWYHLTIDDQAVAGFMRDYVVDLEDKIAKPTSTPKPTATPVKEIADEELETQESETTEPTPEEEVLAVGETNRDANLRKSMNGTVVDTIKKGKRISVYEVLTDKSGKLWYRLNADGTIGYMRDFVIDLEDDQELEPETEASKESVGTARTNRAANVRVKPDSSAKVVRQISKGTKLYITGKYEDTHDQIWYQISTESGNTKGFMRDYVLESVKLNDGLETQTYQDETEEEKDNKIASSSKWKYAGNKSTKVLHELSCDNLSSASENLVYFDSRAYAISKGYKPCGNCNP